MKVDIIFLTKTENLLLFDMTKEAIDSLINSENEHEFDIIVIESQKDCQFKYDYPNVKTIEFGQPDFNYNHAVNLGLNNSTNHLVGWANNDVVFTKGWFSNLINTNEFKENKLASFSCHEPTWLPKFGDVFGNKDVVMGYRVSCHICGWFILTNRDVINEIGGLLDENFKFWYQDDDYSKTLQSKSIPHFLVKNSIIYHKLSKSHGLLGNKSHEYTNGMVNTFKQKWLK